MSATENKPEAPKLGRRSMLLQAAGAISTIAVFDSALCAVPEGGVGMFGLISKMTAVAGKRDELIATLLEGSKNLPGCLMYVVAQDGSDGDAIWITEVWKDKESHEASLTLPPVKGAMSKGRPLIANFSMRAITTPVGGTGLPGSVR